MKLLHTSDWHLGRTLYDKKRYDEFDSFLNWLIDFIKEEVVDLLLVSGDIFDTTTPSNRAQEQYYRFLGQLSGTSCRHVIIAGGNHDSPTFLDAPKSLLGAMNIHVVGNITDDLEDEVFVMKDREGENEAIVCAVPFLRDRDIRFTEDGEAPSDKTTKLLKGVAEHYREISKKVGKLQDKKKKVPVIGMGHLFTRNAITNEGDGVRELYIGSVAHIDGKDISDGFDYMALGHLHMAQKVADSNIIRYSGSPIPMSFAEAIHKKHVLTVTFNGMTPEIEEHQVPCFRKLISISGNIESISARIEELAKEKTEAWIEIEITSEVVATDITTHFNELTEGTNLEILRTRNRNVVNHALTPLTENESLDQLEDQEVFTRCLDAYNITEVEERKLLLETYKEAIDSMVSQDSNAS